MSRHDETPPMKRVLPPSPSKRVIPTNHPAYRNYEARLLAKAEQDITAEQPPRPVCKTTSLAIIALIGLVFVLAIVVSSALLLVLWGLT